MMPLPAPTHQDLVDTISTSSAASTPRADNHDHPSRLRLMCSFGGKIVPRPHDNQLRYVGGDTRIIAVSRQTTYSALLSKLAKTVGTLNADFTVKYQLPNEDLDALISVSNDEDVENMMDEYDRVGSKSARLRLFIFRHLPLSRVSSNISSLLDGSSRRESWFFDALNGGGGSTAGPTVLERGLSEASSIVSEVPDYLFGLDNSDEPAAPLRDPNPNKLRIRSNLADCVSSSDPGSPAPVVISTSSSSSPFLSTSSPALDLPPVNTKIDAPAPAVNNDRPVSMPAGLVQSKAMWQYNPDPQYAGLTAMASSYQQPMPAYYIPGPVQPGNYPVQPAPVQAQYVQIGQQQQIPVGYQPAGMGTGQIHVIPRGGMIKPMGVIGLDGSNQAAPNYYGPVQMYPGMVTAAGVEDYAVSGSDPTGNVVGQ